MGRFFITGSSDGLGLLTAKRLVEAGHEVILHARNEQRAHDAEKACPGAAGVLVADLSSMEAAKQLAAEAAKRGPFDAVIHNAGVYEGQEKVMGPSGLPVLFTVNTLAPYILAASMPRPAAGRRLLIVSSERHPEGRPRLDDLPGSTYSDSKLQDLVLAKALARRWPDVAVNALSPGWVPTKMGGPSAPDKMDDALDTFVLAALGTGAFAGVTGQYLEKSAVAPSEAVADDVAVQEALLAALAAYSSVALPE